MISGDLFTVKPPYSNRGVVNTKIGQYLLFDWIEFTILNKKHTVYEYFYYLFNVKREDVIFEQGGLYGYSFTYSYQNIKIFDSNNNDLGIHVLITGQACRQLEEMNINYKTLFKLICSFNSQFTRLDVSIDDFTDNYYTLDKIKKCIISGEVRSKFRNSIEFKKTSLLDGSNKGHTIWFGSRASNLQIVFYDKLKERESQNIIVNSDIRFWNRLELRFRDDYSNEVITNYLELESELLFNVYIKGIITNYIQFVDRSLSDTNKSRWQIKKWWSDFLDNVNQIRFQNISVEKSISTKKRWLNKSISKSEFSVFISELSDLRIDTVSSSFIYDLLNNGFKKLNDKDLQFINDYRVKNGLNYISYSEINDFISDIQDVLLLRKEIIK